MDPRVFSIDYKSRKPIWEQLVDNVYTLVMHNIIQSDEQLPSVRAMSVELAINPNTIQKAYAELERRGVIYSLQGRGSFIASDTGPLAAGYKNSLLTEISEKFSEAKQLNISKNEINALAEKIWRDTNGDN